MDIDQSSKKTKGTCQALSRASAAVCLIAIVSLSGCASAYSEPCNSPPLSQVLPDKPVLSNPYNNWRRFARDAAVFKEVSKSDAESVRGAAWNVCHSAVALRRYTPEVVSDMRPRLAASLSAVITKSSEISGKARMEASDISALSDAITELSVATPKFWRSPAAALRGRNQPGSPLRKHS